MKTWRKLGQVYLPRSKNCHIKLVSHAANPLPIHLYGNVFRVFFSGRDQNNRSSIGAVDMDIIKCIVVKEYYYPFFNHGPQGSFYADGVSIGNCYVVDGVRYMLFMGWQNSEKQHWRGDIGRLRVTPDLNLEIDSSKPFINCDLIDQISLSYPWVHTRKTGGFDMWYGSTISWDAGNGEMLHVIKHAYSSDGHNWIKTNLCVPYEIGKAQAFSRPTVVENENGTFEMWFSLRSGLEDKYKIGYASSINGKDWKLDLNNSGISVSDSGWDAEMIEYPYVFDHLSSRYMFYNGNGFGKTGFGLAILDSI